MWGASLVKYKSHFQSDPVAGDFLAADHHLLFFYPGGLYVLQRLAGWEGHQPVEVTDAFLPHLEASGFAVRVEDSSRVYADA